METIQPAIDRLAEISTQLSSETLAEASKLLDELAVALRQGERIARIRSPLQLMTRAIAHSS